MPARPTAPGPLAAEVGGFDVVIVAAGSAQLSLDALGLLRRNGVAVLLGIDGHDRDVSLPGPVIGVDAILGNRALLGSVNANVVDWHAAVDGLDAARRRWPDALDRFVGLRTGLDDFAAAFAFGGVKATLTLGATSEGQSRCRFHQFSIEARRIAARSSGPASRGATARSRCCLKRALDERGHVVLAVAERGQAARRADVAHQRAQRVGQRVAALARLAGQQPRDVLDGARARRRR